MTDVAERTNHRPGRTATDTGWFEFDIHGVATMRVAKDAPTAPQLCEMFAPFLAPGSGPASGQYDITVSATQEPMIDAAHAEHEYRFTDSALWLAASDVQITLNDGRFSVRGTRELLTFVLPLVDRVLTGRNVAMFHAATVDYQGLGVALPAWGGVGKTSTIAKLMRIEGVGFMGDDWAFMTGDGQLLGYAKPMFIKPHHRPIFPHLFENKRKPLVPKKLSKPVAQFTTIVHPLVTKYPRLAGLSRHWSPEHMMVTPGQALPNSPIATSAPLAVSIFVERFDGRVPVLETKDEAWMVTRLLGNFHSELPKESRDVITALASTGLVSLEAMHADKADVFRKAVAGRPCFSLRVPAAMSADEASDAIVAKLHLALADSGLR